VYSVQIQNFANDGIDFEASGNMVLNDSKINDCFNGLFQNIGQVYVHNTEFDNNGNVAAWSAGGKMTVTDSSGHYNNFAFAAEGGTMELYNDRAMFNNVAMFAQGGTLHFADCLISDNIRSYQIELGGTMAGSSPGTSLITSGQMTVGTLSTAVVLQ